MQSLTALVLMTILITAACGRTIRVRDDRPDPDTLDAITKVNERALDGNWTATNGALRFHLTFEGKKYSALIHQGDSLKVSDRGTVAHWLPGVVYLHSSNEGCSAKPEDDMIMNFDIEKSSVDSLMMLDDSRKGSLKMTATDAIEFPPLGICLYDGTPKDGYSIN